MARFAAGKRTRLPYRVQRQMIAARYGTSPQAVDEWPADDFIDAAAFYHVTGGANGR